jgi:hypothetical protein
MMPVTMKRGRAGTRIEVLCRPVDAGQLEELLLIGDPRSIALARCGNAPPAGGDPDHGSRPEIAAKLVSLPNGGRRANRVCRRSSRCPGDWATSAGYFTVGRRRRERRSRVSVPSKWGPMPDGFRFNKFRRNQMSVLGETTSWLMVAAFAGTLERSRRRAKSTKGRRARGARGARPAARSDRGEAWRTP